MSHSKKIILGLGLLVIVCFFVIAQLYKTVAVLQNPKKVSQDEVATLVFQVGKLMVLPANEQPTVATVSDPSKLKDQPFFAHAEAGDKVLIYQTSQKAILYRPSVNKIIEVSPINLNNTTSTQATKTSI
ncbi:hypothetical protein H0W91_00580 [Patescibacteria group bacterium]|nr:hypothetical protein [Patescibacteria group bacterium]